MLFWSHFTALTTKTGFGITDIMKLQHYFSIAQRNLQLGIQFQIKILTINKPESAKVWTRGQGCASSNCILANWGSEITRHQGLQTHLHMIIALMGSLSTIFLKIGSGTSLIEVPKCSTSSYASVFPLQTLLSAFEFLFLFVIPQLTKVIWGGKCKKEPLSIRS